ncbi:MAG TPA: hypothetical protein VFA67_19155, partial [Candidatus Sulfotelmatobacter sp.]|nr:hypothetical protein [Candidatus Sulfotelmatobacter sp.]
MKRFPLPVLLALGATLTFTGCASIAPPQPPSLDLPKPPQDLRATRKGDRVTLTWTVPNTTTDRQRTRGATSTRICRSTTADFNECGTPVGKTPPGSPGNQASGQKVAASYVDTLSPEIMKSSPSGFVTYAVEVLNRAGRGAGLSNRVQVLLAPVLPPPQGFEAKVTSQGVVLNWTGMAVPEQQQIMHFLVRVCRREQGSPQQIVVGELLVNGPPSLTDSGIAWEKTYEYYAETVTVVPQPNGTDAQVEGDDTPSVKVFAHDVFPPAVPSGLQAVFSGPGQSPFIDLVWAPVSDADLAGYLVYRHEEGAEPVQLNSEALKTPAYRDTQVSPG